VVIVRDPDDDVTNGRAAAKGPGLAGMPRVWAMASGKGGVGKSVVTSSLAIAFARRGRRCALLDLDLGGANLHTLLGVPRLRPNLSDFLRREVACLSEVLGSTGIENLWIASGDRSPGDAANPSHSQKEKLIRHIRHLEVDDVFLDLGAGSAFHVMDFFLAANHGVLLVTPEPTAIENSYHFLKAAFFRSLRRSLRDPLAAEALKQALVQRSSRGVRSPLDLVRAVADIDPAEGEKLARRMRTFKPMLLVNQARDPRQRELGTRLARECRAHLGVEARALGSICADENVPLAVQRGEPVHRLSPNGRFAADIDLLAQQLLSEQEPKRDRGQEPRATSPVRDGRLEPTAPGDTLRRRREQLGLCLEALVDRTRIRCLDDIEKERFDELPPEFHVRCFVDQYARALGIEEPGQVVERFVSRYRQARA
jgi:flagellar biosynthesis protein FlhG